MKYKYSIDRLSPGNGETLTSMLDNGNYELEQIGEYKTLQEAITEVQRLTIKDYFTNQKHEYDVKELQDGEVIISTLNGVLPDIKEHFEKMKGGIEV